ncbi:MULTISPECIES: hypothetical protein [Bacillus subtilis group]|uniref:hypothetical protein n=1 Tax=Bacillus subtilis group TaxID=653685 RepID=UPI00227F5DEA|nr:MULTISPECIES: hypothetical protein [Bacillus subtilis group]MCY7802329.1 hypothetical protein [Bacillus spizizenii]MCY7895077.1 hypothetical protein [Bacillus vallismortis]MCY7919378.1 hypothetical protein [Bacillus vallismortis]MCY8307144.1 hypothetical protein [Bacillus vallismortis]MCY9175109.1 hypothetical protein [Bacillus inaquosorum]
MKFKKAFYSLVLLGVLTVPTVAFAASSYTFSYDFKYKLNSDLISFSRGTHSRTLKINPTVPGKFSVDLYRANNLGVGVLQSTLTFSGDKEVSKKFTVKNADGKFQLRFRKADDGKYVVGYGLLLDK